VIVATYAPDQTPSAASQSGSGGGGAGGSGSGGSEGGDTTDAGVEGAITPPIDIEDAGPVVLSDEELPLAGSSYTPEKRGISSMIPMLIGIILACCIAAMLLVEYKKRKERRARRRARVTYS
jgi:hypothetical protein